MGEDLATKIAKHYTSGSGDTQAALDPAFILLILDVIQQVVGLWRDCKKSHGDAVHQARNPSVWQKLALRRVVKEELGRAEFRARGDALVEAMLKVGKEITIDDLNKVW